MPRRKQRSSFDQVSEFDREEIVALPRLWIIFQGRRVGRIQTTVMRICDRWMQEGTTDRRVRSHPPQCTTSRADRQIVSMAVTDLSVTSRTVAQHIQSVTHHPVSVRTLRRGLQQSGLSARRPFLRLPLTQNHRRLHRQWCDERRMWTAEWNEIVFTDESRFCLQHHDGRIRVWRHRGERMLKICAMHRHTGPAPGIMVWGGIGYHSRTPLVRIAGTLNSQRYISEVLEPVVLPYFQGLPTAIFKQENARPDVARIVQRFFVNRQIELLSWPARSPDLSPMENMWSMVAQRLTQITSPAATPDQLWQRLEAAWSTVPQEHIQGLFETMPRRVAAGRRVGRIQTTVMRICDRWMQEGTTDRRVRSHPPQCTTSRADRQIVSMAVTDLSVTSRTVAQHIQSVTHHPVSVRTLRRGLQQSGLSARRPFLRLPLTQNHRRLHRQWCDERRMWTAEWNEIVFTDESRFCLQHHDGRIRVWRHRGERMLKICAMHRHTGPAPGIMVWGGIGYHSRTPLVRIAGTLNSQRYISEVLEPVVLPYFQGLPTAIFKQENARPDVARIVQRFFVNRQIELLSWPARSPDLSPMENMWSMVAQRLTQITSPAATPDQLWQRLEAAWSTVPQEHIQGLFETMPRRVAAGRRVGRIQTTVMRICDRWMQEGTTDRRVRSHPPQCTTSRADRQIVSMAVTDLSVTSRTVAQHIQSVTHHPVSVRTLRRGLQQSGLSARRPFLRLPLTQNHRRLHRQWCDERRMWTAEWNEIVFTDESRFCLQHHDGRIRVWRHRGERMLKICAMHRHTGPAPGIMVWGGIGYHSRTPLVRIADTLNSQRYISEVLEPVVLPYFQGLPTAIFKQENARPDVARIVQRFFVNRQIELLSWPARSPDLSPMENMWSMVAQRLTQITSPAATPDQLWQRLEAAWSTVPQEHIQGLFETMPRRVAAIYNIIYCLLSSGEEEWAFQHIRVRQRRDSGLPRLWIIFQGRRVGRIQTTVMRICDRWMQEGTTDRRVRSHPPQCTTSRADRQIVSMAVTDLSVTSRTVAQHIQSVTHHPVSVRTLRRGLQQSGLSARRPFLRLPLTQNHRRLHRQWCDERRMWTAEWNEIVFTDESRFCLQHHDGRIRVWRHRGERMLKICAMHRHTGPAPGIMVWGGIGYHSRTPLVRIAGTLNSQRYISEVLEPVVLPYFQGLPTAIFKQENARPDVARIVQRFFVNRQIELLSWPARSPDLSPMENMWSMVAQRLTQITSPAATPDQLWQRLEAAWSTVPQEHIQGLFETMPRRVAA
ncbi:hypothetical protein LAZ67_2003740, partial [Cordylochernes scorpioides]